MTVSELIDILSKYPPDMEITINNEFGDLPVQVDEIDGMNDRENGLAHGPMKYLVLTPNEDVIPNIY